MKVLRFFLHNTKGADTSAGNENLQNLDPCERSKIATGEGVYNLTTTVKAIPLAEQRNKAKKVFK